MLSLVSLRYLHVIPRYRIVILWFSARCGFVRRRDAAVVLARRREPSCLMRPRRSKRSYGPAERPHDALVACTLPVNAVERREFAPVSRLRNKRKEQAARPRFLLRVICDRVKPRAGSPLAAAPPAAT